MNFSERLRELREKKGISQEALADQLKIPRSSITHYENRSDRLPRQQRLNEIADFFGVSVDYLLGRSDTSELNEVEKRFLEDIDNLSLEELIEKHKPKVDGRPITSEELPVVLAVIRSLRNQK